MSPQGFEPWLTDRESVVLGQLDDGDKMLDAFRGPRRAKGPNTARKPAASKPSAPCESRTRVARVKTESPTVSGMAHGVEPASRIELLPLVYDTSAPPWSYTGVEPTKGSRTLAYLNTKQDVHLARRHWNPMLCAISELIGRFALRLPVSGGPVLQGQGSNLR